MIHRPYLKATIAAWPVGLLTLAAGPTPMPVAVSNFLTGEPTSVPMEVAGIIESTAPPSLAEATTGSSVEDEQFAALMTG